MTTQKKVHQRLNWIQGLSLVGLAISFYQTLHFFQLRTGQLGFKSICNMGASFNCDAVDASRFAELLPNVPLAAFAAGWFLMMALVALFTRWSEKPSDWLATGLVFSAVGTVFSLLYLGVMMVSLKTFCLFCLGVDVVNFSLLGLYLSTRPHMGPTFNWKLTGGFAFSAGLVGIIFAQMVGSQARIPTDQMDELVESVLGNPTLPVTEEPGAYSRGPADAPVTIVKFSDFQCPACKRGALALHPVLELHGSKIRFVFRNFPLDSGCNRAVERAMHPAACEAAKVGICAQKAGKFAQMYEIFFERQEKLAPGMPTKWAVELGMNADELKNCVESQATKDQLNRDIEEALKLGIRSTPTFFVNGKKAEGGFPPPVWNRLLSRLIQ